MIKVKRFLPHLQQLQQIKFKLSMDYTKVIKFVFEENYSLRQPKNRVMNHQPPPLSIIYSLLLAYK